jgi:hypothetical protein
MEKTLRDIAKALEISTYTAHRLAKGDVAALLT